MRYFLSITYVNLTPSYPNICLSYLVFSIFRPPMYFCDWALVPTITWIIIVGLLAILINIVKHFIKIEVTHLKGVRSKEKIIPLKKISKNKNPFTHLALQPHNKI